MKLILLISNVSCMYYIDSNITMLDNVSGSVTNYECDDRCDIIKNMNFHWFHNFRS